MLTSKLARSSQKSPEESMKERFLEKKRKHEMEERERKRKINNVLQSTQLSSENGLALQNQKFTSYEKERKDKTQKESEDYPLKAEMKEEFDLEYVIESYLLLFENIYTFISKVIEGVTIVIKGWGRKSINPILFIEIVKEITKVRYFIYEFIEKYRVYEKSMIQIKLNSINENKIPQVDEKPFKNSPKKTAIQTEKLNSVRDLQRFIENKIKHSFPFQLNSSIIDDKV